MPAGARIKQRHNRFTHIALADDGDFLGFAAVGGVWLEVDPENRRVKQVLEEAP